MNTLTEGRTFVCEKGKKSGTERKKTENVKKEVLKQKAEQVVN